ncbi:MAG: Crp/Fnr family transcriptional regulator [Bacteroidota bacterium]
MSFKNPFEKLRRHFPVSDAKWNEYTGAFQRMEVKPKKVLLKEGSVSTKVFFVEKGCLRAWFDNNGHDITLQFFIEGQVVSSIESYHKKIPSPISIEAIEHSVVWWIGKTELDKIVEEVKDVPKLRDLLIDGIFERTFNYMRLFFSATKDSPQERYLNLIKEHPEIVKRIPQHYIASYLGITKVHLSRIKGKLAHP